MPATAKARAGSGTATTAGAEVPEAGEGLVALQEQRQTGGPRVPPAGLESAATSPIEPVLGGSDAVARMHSTASAATSMLTSSSARSRFEGERSTWSAPCSLPPGGLPMPMRTRVKASEWRWALMERSPLWPASPPPGLDPHDARAAGPARRARPPAGPGPRSRSGGPGGRRPGRSRSCRSAGRPGPAGGRRPATSATRACSLDRFSRSPWRPASRATVSAPALCRVLGELGARVAEPHRQQVRRACPTAARPSS